MCLICAQINQAEVGVVEQWGKFSRIAEPGCHFLCCLTGHSMAGTLSTRVEQLDVTTDSKTKDNVTISLKIAAQFAVINGDIPDREPAEGKAVAAKMAALPDMDREPKHGVYRAYYKLNDIRRQMSPYIEDVVRSEIPKLSLDECYENKEAVAEAVEASLSINMEQYGYKIVNTLVTDLVPDRNVLRAMNDIETKKRERAAAQQAAEAKKVMVVMAAEAEKEARKLNGEGIADQRKAIVEGLKESVCQFNEGVVGTTPADVMQLMMVSQYTDMLKDVGGTAHSTVFVPNGASAVGDIQQQMRQGFMEANAIERQQVRPIQGRAMEPEPEPAYGARP